MPAVKIYKFIFHFPLSFTSSIYCHNHLKNLGRFIILKTQSDKTLLTSLRMISRLSESRSISLDTPIGITRIISCISFCLFVNNTVRSFTAGHLTWKSYSWTKKNTANQKTGWPSDTNKHFSKSETLGMHSINFSTFARIQEWQMNWMEIPRITHTGFYNQWPLARQITNEWRRCY